MDTIQSLWIGNTLSTMERLCMKSFLANGHPFNLYVYAPVLGVPEGVQVLDANEILPREIIKEFNYTAQFSDYFRYMLVYHMGGWWVDTDIVCLRPFDFKEDTVVSGADGCIHNSPFKAPEDSKWLGYALDRIDACRADWKKLDWAGLGGPLLSEAAKHHPVPVVNQYLFDPFQNSSGYQRYVQSDLVLPADFDEMYSVHLHHAMWTLSLGGAPRLDPDAKYPDTSLYETLKRRYGL